MDNILSLDRLREIFDDSARVMLRRVTGIELRSAERPPAGDVCTVFTVFGPEVRSGLALCADTELFNRLAYNMMFGQAAKPEDTADAAREFFNVLCGHIAVRFYRETQKAARFEIPVFLRGRSEPEEFVRRCEMNFIGDGNVGASLIHYTDPGRWKI